MLSGVGLSKSFGSLQALMSVDIEVRPNEVVGLVGENGAGKSTLMRILSGIMRPSSGQLLRNGVPVTAYGGSGANSQGITMVFQEQSLLLNLSVAENLFLGQETQFIRFGLINWKAMQKAASRYLAKVGLNVEPSTLTAKLSFAQRQMVELAKALSLEERVTGDLIILLDEPTSVLEAAEIDVLFSKVRALKSRASFVFVSHRLDEVLEISDRIYVLKDGEVVAGMRGADANVPYLHRVMVGHDAQAEYFFESEQTPPRDTVVLETRGLGMKGRFSDVNLTLREGEVLGIAGVIGSGREDVIRTLFGLEQPSQGEICIRGEVIAMSSPAEAVQRGLGFVPSERRVEGLVMMLPVSANISLAKLQMVEGPVGISPHREIALAKQWIDRLSIRPPRPSALCQSFSGGNQQKVVLAKWLTAGTRILLLDHPTRGIDVGAKEEVFRLIRQLSRDGVSIILLADTLEETIGLSHSVLVMRDGRITARVPAASGHKPPPVQILEHMV